MIAGSKESLYVGDVKDVFDFYADYHNRVFGFSPKDKPSMFNANTLRQIRSFVVEFGVDDAKKIIEELYSQKYSGRYKGRVVGNSIFSSGFRWLANELLTERLSAESEIKNLWRKF